MYALLAKEWRVGWQWMVVAFCLLGYFLTVIAAMTVAMPPSIERIGICVLTTFVTIVNLHRQRHMPLLLSLPITRRTLLASRYLIDVLWMTAVYLTATLLLTVGMIFSNNIPRIAMVVSLLTMIFCLSLLFVWLYIPFYYCFDLRRVRLAAQIVFAGGMLLLSYGGGSRQGFSYANRLLFASGIRLSLLAAIAAVMLIVGLLSYFATLQVIIRHNN